MTSPFFFCSGGICFGSPGFHWEIGSLTDCDIISETPDVDNDNHPKKQEEASIIETPSEQMRKIFEQAVVDCNIALHICKLPDYLLGESFFGSEYFTFAETIHTRVLKKFSIYKCENTFIEISEFNDMIKSYSGFLGLIRLSVSEKYGSLLMTKGDINEILSMIDSDYNEIKNNLGKKISIEGGEATDSSVFELQSKLN